MKELLTWKVSIEDVKVMNEHCVDMMKGMIDEQLDEFESVIKE